MPVQYERSFRWKLGQFRYLCQSNQLPSHIKINCSRNSLFEDSFQQVSVCVCFCQLPVQYLVLLVCGTITLLRAMQQSIKILLFNLAGSAGNYTLENQILLYRLH